MNDRDATLPGPLGFFMVVSAPSGTGKTSICRQVLKACPNIRFSVSYTTRRPRPGEVEGRDYHFVAEKVFRQMQERGEFLEWAENFGNLYGTSGNEVQTFLNQGFDVMLDVEPRGAKALKDHLPGGVFVFILPPNLSELKLRLDRRGFENADVIARRFHSAMDDIREVFWYDYVLFNDKLSEAVRGLEAIYIAERQRTQRLHVRIRTFLEQQSRAEQID